ncbi:MAG: pseudouridine synthase [Thermodesulfobacteriota bacterium]
MVLKRIQTIIRDAGLASRRKAEEMILEGRVTLAGKVVENLGAKADPEKDHIKVDGKLLRPVEKAKFYFIFNKPRNVVSTMSDPEGRPCLGELLKSMKIPLFTVGRLDFDAEGLMILTNDGELAQKLGHPSFRVPRQYLVKVRGNPDDETLDLIRKGMDLGEGDRLGDVECEVIKRQKTTTWARVTLYEGKKNEIKRIFDAIRHPVRKIRRVSFGPFTLGKVPSGALRQFTPEEMAQLRRILREPAKKKEKTTEPSRPGKVRTSPPSRRRGPRERPRG